MGYLKARMSSLPVKELELVYLGCLVVALLAFSLRPVDYTDTFPYPDPGTSFLDKASDMVFTIANDTLNYAPNTSLFLNMDTTGNKTFEAGSKKIIFNSTTKPYSTHESRKPVLPRDPTLLKKRLQKRIHCILYRYKINSRAPVQSFSSRFRIRRSLNGSLHSYPGREEGEEEFEEFLDMFSPRELNITILNAAYRRHGDLIAIAGLSIYIPFSLDIPFSGPECGDKSSNNNLQYTMKVVFITFGSTTLFFIIFFLSWKHIKNLTCLGLSHGLNTFFLSTSTLDETFLIDHNIYEMLLTEAILVSSGSSGIVYKIKFFELECAMKVFFSHARMDFRRESVIVANLDHPNIIKFFCCFRKSFIIMELLDEDLYSFIKQIRERTSDHNLPLEVALDVMLQIAKGMSYLHEEGIAHQDLKSLNIFLKLQGEPHSSNFRIIAKIADFGNARAFDPRHPRGFFLRPMENIGTRSWRAPELFLPRGGFLTKVFGMACEILPKPLDIYGFAIICSELLTKQIPFSNTNEQRIVHGVEVRAGLRPTLPSRGCPEELIALIEDCWHTNPQSRPEFREICTRLSRLIEVHSHEQTPSTL